ncbi:Putative DNA-directed RNA polymerase I, subunit RPA34.5 [Septoria linicola]|uniref:DNA-directed RNA polymerase I, subunit RPA34.5 n=1 Tax=Septoria linicola TaxID=215465 RepID=A0A9Q9EQV0_9PEZI|nr:putative DNA-directed RNA polymerase I, subunit RPA34.5 [Septoria linicola]USW59207.1 Putative DNA-directed RNA polymerase I, subunit RPA34.5 [Septoria linicola]
MAKAKEAKAAPKKAKTEDKTAKKKSTKAAAPKSKVAGLSEERVVDSDSDEEKTAVKAASVPASQKPAKEKKEKRSKTKAAVSIPTPPTKEPTPSSSDDDEEESSSEESDDDEEMADAPVLKKPDTVPSKVNGVKRKAESVSSLDDGESSDDDSSEEDAKPNPKRVKTALKDAGEVEQIGQAAAGEDDDSDSDSESEKDESTGEPSADTPPAPNRPQHSGNLQSIPVQSFKAPSGFSGVQVTNATFSANSFPGRQIWHIVAPSNVPLKSLADVSLDAIQSGAAILRHKDTEYSLIEDANPNDKFDNIVTPSSTSYDCLPQPISKTFHIRQRVSLPRLSKKQADPNAGSAAAADIAQPSISEARPQPKGMRMRYKPAGFGAGDPGLGSDSEEYGVQAKTNGTKFQFPKALGAHGAATEADKLDAPKIKKSKKKRKDSDVEMVNGDAVTSAQPETTPSSINKGSVANIAGTSVGNDELSKEEKKRRKAAKQEKRASKVAVAV